MQEIPVLVPFSKEEEVVRPYRKSWFINLLYGRLVGMTPFCKPFFLLRVHVEAKDRKEELAVLVDGIGGQSAFARVGDITVGSFRPVSRTVVIEPEISCEEAVEFACSGLRKEIFRKNRAIVNPETVEAEKIFRLYYCLYFARKRKPLVLTADDYSFR